MCLLIVALDSAPFATYHPLETQAALHRLSASDLAESEDFASLTCEVQDFVDDMLRANARIEHLLCALEDDPRHSRFLALSGTIKLLRKAHTMLCDNKEELQEFMNVLHATRQ